MLPYQNGDVLKFLGDQGEYVMILTGLFNVYFSQNRNCIGSHKIIKSLSN